MNISLRNGEIPKPKNNKTFIGIDTNEKNIALSAMNECGEVLGSLILDYPVINVERQKYFIIRKRLNKVRKESVINKIKNKEKLLVRDFFHKISKIAVAWIIQFPIPLIIMEDLTNIRNSINFGKKWNRRLHGWGFRILQSMIEYKVNNRGIPVYYCYPAHTSQTCARCGLQKKSHKKKRGFTCSGCGHVDHRDRNATLNICLVGMNELGLKVPKVKNFPMIRKVRFLALGDANSPSSAIVLGSSGKDQSEENNSFTLNKSAVRQEASG